MKKAINLLKLLDKQLKAEGETSKCYKRSIVKEVINILKKHK